jgi:hypothetical protein
MKMTLNEKITEVFAEGEELEKIITNCLRKSIVFQNKLKEIESDVTRKDEAQALFKEMQSNLVIWRAASKKSSKISSAACKIVMDAVGGTSA